MECSCDTLLLAVGRSGAGLLNSIADLLGDDAGPDQCDVGVRLEFPTSVWPGIDQNHNDLKLQFGKARTFCVCKDGQLAPYRLDRLLFVDGHVDLDHPSGLTNLAVTVRHQMTQADKGALISEITRRTLAHGGGRPIRQHLPDFLASSQLPTSTDVEPASIAYWSLGDVAGCFPEVMADAIREAVGYFVSRLVPPRAYPSVSVFAPELEYYWPRLPLSSAFSSRRPGVFLIGDCSGQFRGILQAFCSGWVCAQHVLGDQDGR